jgi:hypothetical protein
VGIVFHAQVEAPPWLQLGNILKRIKVNKWAWKKVALKAKVQHTLYKGIHK